MKLTATQRAFITERLGVKPVVVRAPVTEGAPAEAEDPASKPNPDGKDAAITGALDEYLSREGKVLEYLGKLDLVAGAAELVASFENEIQQIQTRVRTAVRDSAQAVIQTAYQELEAIKTRAGKEAETGEGNPTFIAKRDAVQKQVAALNGHRQKAHVQTLITEGSTRLAEAIQANTDKKYPESLTKIEAAKTALDKAKTLADKYDAYRVARQPAAAIVDAMKGRYANNATWTGFNAKLTQADLDATPGANKYAEATAAVTTMKASMASTLQTWTQDDLKSQYQGLEASPLKAFVADDIAKLKALHASVPALIANGEWASMRIIGSRAFSIDQGGKDRLARRQAFLDARKKATDAIAPLKANTAMALKVQALEKVLTDQADPLATAAAMRFEEGIALCDKVVADCAALAGTAAAAKTFTDDRKALETRLNTLKGLPTAAKMADTIGSLNTLLAEADKRAAPDVQDWAGGQQWLDRLKTDLTTAEALAPTLASATPEAAKGLEQKALKKGYEDALAATLLRQKALVDQAKTGSYTATLPKVNLIQAPIDQAKAAAGAATPDYAAASAALARAGLAAHEAELVAADIKAYDTRVGPLKTRAGTMKTAGDDVTEVEAALAQAATQMGQLKFPEARKLLDKAEAKMEQLKVKALAKANPDDPAVISAAEALLKVEGGDKMLDEFVKTLGGEDKFPLIAKLCEKRFGIVLTSDAGSKTLSAKAMWQVMADLPPSHATKSPSLKSVERKGPDGGSGGAYANWDKSVEMNGRPNDGGTEKFDKNTRNKALGLPLDHDNATDPYAPVDDQPANLFNMTMLHEVGHAVDDRLGFMASRTGQAAFGGWVQYTDLKPIANAVATEKKYDAGYVLQLMNGYTPEIPPMPGGYAGGEDKWKKAKEAVDTWHTAATTGEIWYSFADSKAASIAGVVYQEAYKNKWVSYVLAERSKGVTGYQWRAPGEWFAEIYMCWFGKKLKPNHPFASWLSTL
ncbi:hypothetical protein [Pelomonas sp. KK5]|uniref:hypothetical protein n=1 Tax=Pelomonas sp. KK5 TaxID=1855730 RepID=UPI00097BC4A2|nr:hypothetical protein [Pelomonas sp. KK5]